MADSNRPFLKHAAVYGVGTLLLQAASVVLLPLYTRYLAPADYGILEILNRTGDVLTVFLMANGLVGAAFTFYCQAKTDEERAGIAATVNLVIWTGIAAGVILALFGSGLIDTLLGIGDRRLTVLGLCASFAQLLPMMPMALMQARVESVAFIVASAAILLLRLGFIIVAVVVGGWGIFGVLGGTFFASLVAGTVLTVREFRKSGFRPDLSRLPEVLRFAWPFMPGGFCAFIMNSGDRFFLLRYAGAEEVGLYALGYRLASCVGLVSFTPLFKVWSARMYDAYRRPDGPVVVGQMFTAILSTVTFVSLGLCLFQQEILLVLGTSAYADATTVIAPLVVASLFLNAQMLMDGAFYVHRCSSVKLGITLFVTAVILVLYWMLVPLYHAMGAAFAVLIAFAVYASVTCIVSQRVFRVRYEPVRLLCILGLAVLLAAPSYWLELSLLTFVGKCVLLAAWPTLLWLSGIVRPEEKRYVAGLFVQFFRYFVVPEVAAKIHETVDSPVEVP
jgi:O-antigen/teichoic acid export membrane protein